MGYFVLQKMGGNARRLLACPAQIPHVVGRALFAGTFRPSIPPTPALIPRENSARSRQSRFAQFGTSSAHSAGHGQSATPGHPAERFFEARKVAAKPPVVT